MLQFHAPKPIITVTLISGKTSVRMGVYAYSTRADDDEYKFLTRGFTVCPVKTAAEAMDGLFDPEINARIGFGAPRATSVAIAGGTGSGGYLTDDQKLLAARFCDDLSAVKIEEVQDQYRVSPVSLTKDDPTLFDVQNSTALYMSYDVQNNMEIRRGLAQKVIDTVTLQAHRFNQGQTTTESVDSMLTTFEEEPIRAVERPIRAKSHVEAVDKGKAARDRSKQIFADYFTALTKHLPESLDGNEMMVVLEKMAKFLELSVEKPKESFDQEAFIGKVIELNGRFDRKYTAETTQILGDMAKASMSYAADSPPRP